MVIGIGNLFKGTVCDINLTAFSSEFLECKAPLLTPPFLKTLEKGYGGPHGQGTDLKYGLLTVFGTLSALNIFVSYVVLLQQ